MLAPHDAPGWAKTYKRWVYDTMARRMIDKALPRWNAIGRMEQRQKADERYWRAVARMRRWFR